MRIAIIGAGNVGGALGKGWARAGHEIIYGVREPGKPAHARTADAAGGARVATPAEAVQRADVVVLAVPWGAAAAAIAACGGLTGRVLIDATNPLRFTDAGMELEFGFDTSAGEKIAALAPAAQVVKTLNQVGFAVMASASGYPAPPVMFVASDHEAAKRLAMGLVGDLGFEALDGGALKSARLLEPMAMLWIDQVYKRGAPIDSAFALVRRSA
jgi:8-hydroxy-5-deazaflavin:NADPH oxidoreductase